MIHRPTLGEAAVWQAAWVTQRESSKTTAARAGRITGDLAGCPTTRGQYKEVAMVFVEKVTTWTTMRGDFRRTHVRLSDLLDATMETGRRWSVYEVRKAIAHVPRPTVKRYGHWHYDQRHLEAVRAAVREEVAKCHT